VTFGHHNNKRPELVIGALALLNEPEFANLKLVVLGAKGEYQSQLSNLAEELTVSDQCCFPGFVSEKEYQKIIANASVVIMASSDEGFGLPITEAQYFGIPAVLASDSGVGEIHGADVILAEPSNSGMAKAIRFAISQHGVSTANTDSVKVHGWDDTAASLREVACRVASNRKKNDDRP
jgi:glycosyltransferase involved in cell wall biosynthesis